MKLKVSRRSKFFCLLMTFLAVLGMFVSASVSVYASENNDVSKATITSDEYELAEIIGSSLIAENSNNGVKQVKIASPEYLKESLKPYEDTITYDQIENAVSKFNQYIAEDNDVIKSLTTLDYSKVPENLENNRKAITCETVMSALGYAHAGMYAVAATMLGITGPAAVAVPLLIGAIYQMGALLCK